MNFLRCLSVWVFMVFLMNMMMSLSIDAKPIQSTASIQRQLIELESASNGHLGVSAINTADNARIEYRSQERFPLCSTSKVMAVAAILKQSEQNNSLLQQLISYKPEDISKSGYAPITQQHLGSTMSIHELCQAAIEYSDNTAMNLLMKILGGPAAVTAYARSIGDTTFRLDRWEPELNTAIPGDQRDTTTPYVMANSLRQLVLKNALALPQRKQLQIWLIHNTTGDNRIRSGVPKGWVVGDKTGTGQYGTTNDIAIIWPPRCAPIVMAIYFTQKEKKAAQRDEVIASAARLVLSEFANNDQCIKNHD